MLNIERQLDALFGSTDLPADATGDLRHISEAMADFSPSLLYIADAAGDLVAVHQADSGPAEERIRALAKEAAKECAERSTGIYPCDEERGVTFALYVPGSHDERMVFGGLVPSAPGIGDRLREAVPLLSCCGLLAVKSIHMDRCLREFETRSQHLEASRDTLQASYGEMMAAAIEERERRIEHKTQFLANMSHEIRTPMTAILGFANILMEDGDLDNTPPERVDAIRTIHRNGEHLLGIIDSILDLTKIEAGKMTVERIPCSVREIIGEVTAMMRVRCDAKGLLLTGECLNEVPDAIRTDPTRLRQILINLTGNAVKFTERGSVRLVARPARRKDDRPTSAKPLGPSECVLQFDVTDTGIGIDPSHVSELFTPFTQADPSMARRYGGTGLGLALSKRLAEVLGGDIGVESRLGEGSTFSLRIVVEATAPEAFEKSSNARPSGPGASGFSTDAIRGCHILLAEDGVDNQRLISALLKKVGAEVTVVDNGQAAAEKAMAACQEARSFDIILMDMQMPVLDGYQASRLLREKGYTGIFIALTAHAMDSDRRKCLDAGCDDYATKPIGRDRLLQLVAGSLGRRSSIQAAKTTS